jgi:hypothetical protein
VDLDDDDDDEDDDVVVVVVVLVVEKANETGIHHVVVVETLIETIMKSCKSGSDGFQNRCVLATIECRVLLLCSCSSYGIRRR